jgi:hypothetical protein
MSQFNISSEEDHDIRWCQSHAFAAHLFARYPLHPSNADVWAEVARCWDDLARMKAQIAKSDADTAQMSLQLLQAEAARPVSWR